MTSVWVYDQGKILKVFASEDAARAWLKNIDPEGVAFECPIEGDEVWPSPGFQIGQRDHLHALGVIMATYNLLEWMLFGFFVELLKLPPEHARKIFSMLSNPARIELMQDAARATTGWRDQMLHFIEGFKTLATTRNYLAHSLVIQNTIEQDHLTFAKGSKRHPGELSFAHLTLPEIRQIADQMREFWQFGAELATAMRGIPRGALIPPNLPKELTGVPHPEKKPIGPAAV